MRPGVDNCCQLTSHRDRITMQADRRAWRSLLVHNFEHESCFGMLCIHWLVDWVRFLLPRLRISKGWRRLRDDLPTGKPRKTSEQCGRYNPGKRQEPARMQFEKIPCGPVQAHGIL